MKLTSDLSLSLTIYPINLLYLSVKSNCFQIYIMVCNSKLAFRITMSIFTTPTFILTSAFVAFLVQVIFNMVNIWSDVPLLADGTSEAAITRNLNILQSHPRCGLTSGGREECWWNCSRKGFQPFSVYITVGNTY